MNPHRPPIVWTPQMLKILRDYYPTMFNKALAKWLGVSLRTLYRKSAELGLHKFENFNEVRADGIAELLSESVKKAYAEGRKTSQFKKGVRNNQHGEFRPGHKYDDETEERRIAAIRKTFQKRRQMKIYGLSK